MRKISLTSYSEEKKQFLGHTSGQKNKKYEKKMHKCHFLHKGP